MISISDPTAPLWTRARAMYARAVAAIGDAALIAMRALISRSARKEIIAWLCPLEHVVRKLLLAEAAEIHRAERTRAARAPRIEYVPLHGIAMHVQGGSASLQARTSSVAGVSEPQGSRSNREQPETWRANFSFALPRDPHVVPDSRAPRIRTLSDQGAAGFQPAEKPAQQAGVQHGAPFRIARRFEALRRVLEDPRPYAERLARILAREVRRFRDIARRYAIAPCRTNGYDPEDARLGIDAMGAGFRRAETAFADSG